MKEYVRGKCYMCRETTEVRHKNLYVYGSEGIWVCIKCEIKILEFIRNNVKPLKEINQ